MACFAVTLALIILSGFIHLSAANKDICELYAAVGQSLTLPLDYDGLSNSHVLRWTHNTKIIFYRERGRVNFGKAGDISSNGSLQLKNLQSSSGGVYQAKVLHPNNTLAKEWTGRLCMLDKVSKPQLTYSCDFKSKAVNLDCNVANPQGLVFSWTLDENILTSETKQKLSISLEKLKWERRFTCSVANKVSKEQSDTVRPACKVPTPAPQILRCFAPKTVVSVLAGGAGVILILLIIVITLCCRLRRYKAKMRLMDKGELRMLSLSKRDPESLSPEYETMHPTEDSPAPSPEPSPRACYKNVSQPEAQTENKLPQPATADEGHQPSPVPKPRTRVTQTQNI